jgi:hypothetical protein
VDMRGAAEMASTPLVAWECPNCWQSAVTAPWMPNRFHTCPGLHMLAAPMVRAGVKAKVEAHTREDYQGREQTQDGDDGRPYMNVVTTRDDGQDCAVLAPCATAAFG